MDSLFLLVFCLLAGVLLQRVPSFPPNAALTLNQYVLYAPLPALALYHIPEIDGGSELLYPIAVAWICFGSACKGTRTKGTTPTITPKNRETRVTLAQSARNDGQACAVRTGQAR